MQISEEKPMLTKENRKDKWSEAGARLMRPGNITEASVGEAEELNGMEQGMLGVGMGAGVVLQ